jgi:hypothetical protein
VKNLCAPLCQVREGVKGRGWILVSGLVIADVMADEQAKKNFDAGCVSK